MDAKIHSNLVALAKVDKDGKKFFYLAVMPEARLTVITTKKVEPIHQPSF